MSSKVVKIVILGDGGAGKSTLLRARKDHIFLEDSKVTIGVDVCCIPFDFSEFNNPQKTFLTFDLGGQERFQCVQDAYLKGIKLAIIVYDLTRFSSIFNTINYYTIIWKENPHIPIFIVGTKKDLVEPEKIVTFQEEGQRLFPTFPNPENIIEHLFISSKTFEGIEDLFKKCEEKIKFLIQKT